MTLNGADQRHASPLPMVHHKVYEPLNHLSLHSRKDMPTILNTSRSHTQQHSQYSLSGASTRQNRDTIEIRLDQKSMIINNSKIIQIPSVSENNQPDNKTSINSFDEYKESDK